MKGPTQENNPRRILLISISSADWNWKILIIFAPKIAKACSISPRRSCICQNPSLKSSSISMNAPSMVRRLDDSAISRTQPWPDTNGNPILMMVLSSSGMLQLNSLSTGLYTLWLCIGRLITKGYPSPCLSCSWICAICVIMIVARLIFSFFKILSRSTASRVCNMCCPFPF